MEVDYETMKIIAITSVVVILLIAFISKFLCQCEKYEDLGEFVPVEKEKVVLPDTSDEEKEIRNKEQLDYIINSKPF